MLDIGSLFFRFLPIPAEPGPVPEYAYIQQPDKYGVTKDDWSQYYVFVASWNNTWEAASARPEIFSATVPEKFRWVLGLGQNLRLVWRSEGHSYDPYAPLYRLLPRDTLERFGLPLLRRGIWPQHADNHLLRHIIPCDFDEKMERALTYHLWPFLGARGKPSTFSKTGPIRVLSHNLDYWMPYIDLVAQRRARSFGRTELENPKQTNDYYAHKDEMPPGLSLQTPLRGGALWCGEDEAKEATREMVETADERGDLRAILDAVRSNRVKDDFSARWSFEREDFERRLYSKRNKVKVTFVELDDTIPVHGPRSEVDEKVLWEDFLALVDPKDRRVVVCLRNGTTRIGEIAKLLGYANHSPISKCLARIRKKARRFFELS